MQRTVLQSILQTIGNTPIVPIKNIFPKSPHQFFAKIEYFNPGGSIKDRVALAMIEEAEKRGELRPGGTIVEATSGNTGVGLALVASVKGYKCIFVMPEKMSEEKRAILRGYGAKVVITPTGVEPEDPLSHYSVAKKIAETTSNSFYVNQYNNKDNPERHYHTTGPEIWEQMGGEIDVFVGGAGTGGTLTGCARFLKEKNPHIKVVCADPVGSILYDLYYSGKVISPPAPYQVEGVGEDMLPDNVQMKYYDAFVQVTDPEAFRVTTQLAQQEGLLVGPSSALALVGAFKYSQELQKPSKILVVFPDSGRAYLSKAFNQKWLETQGLLPSGSSEKAFNQVISAKDYFQSQGIIL